MIKIVIVEDEEAAAKRLQKLISEMMPTAEFLCTLNSVKSSVEWFKNNESADLVFVDIQLSDGQSFEIFKQVQVAEIGRAHV